MQNKIKNTNIFNMTALGMIEAATDTRVLLLDEGAPRADITRRVFAAAGIAPKRLSRSRMDEIRRILRKQRIECVVIDQSVIDESTLALLQEIRSQVDTVPPAIVLIGEPQEADRAAEWVRYGGKGFLARGSFGAEQLRAVIAGALAQARSERELVLQVQEARRKSNHDALTGLANRAFFTDHLESMIRRGRSEGSRFALMILDLDGFKGVNDSYGHGEGDRLLRQVAERLQKAVRRSDMVARLGGDEFAILTSSNVARTGIERMARKLSGVIEEGFTVDGHKVPLGISIGVACYPDHGDTQTELLEKSDQAMYASKYQGERFHVWGQERRWPGSLRQQTLALALANDTELNHLCIDPRPVFNLETGSTAATVAELRWCHPRLGELSPDRFWQALEGSHRRAHLARRVVTDALAGIWRPAEEGAPGPLLMPIDVELLRDAGFPGWLQQQAEAKGWEAEDIILLLRFPSKPLEAASILQSAFRLHERGFRLALDGFGSAGLAFSLLRDLPLSYATLDAPSLEGVTNSERNRDLLSSAITMMSRLGIETIAPEIPNEDCRAILREHGCNLAVGPGATAP